MAIHLAGCVILDSERKIFLLHRNKKGVTQWELPGGKVETGEGIEDAASREIHEELGVAARIIRKLGEASFTENHVDYFYTWYLAEAETGLMQICEPESFDDLKAFSIMALPELELSNNMKKLYKSLIEDELKI